MLKKTFFPFVWMAAGLGLTAAAAQAGAFVLDLSAGQAAFFAEGLLAIVLYTGLLARFARWQVSARNQSVRLLRIWPPLFVGVLLLFSGGQLVSNAGGLFSAPDLFLSAFFCMFWFTAGSYLLLAAAGRTLWGLPLPRCSLRSVGRLCLSVLAGSGIQFILNWLSLSLFYHQSDTLLGLYGMMTGSNIAIQAILHGLSMVVTFSAVYAAALTWAAE